MARPKDFEERLEAIQALEKADADVPDTSLLNLQHRSDGNIHIGRARLNGTLILTEAKTRTEYRLEDEELAQVVIGRADRKAQLFPAVDLTAVGAAKAGVSRFHATIALHDGLLILTDHGSRNGTYLNGKQLVSGQGRVVRDDDTIHISAIELKVRFQQKSAKQP